MILFFSKSFIDSGFSAIHITSIEVKILYTGAMSRGSTKQQTVYSVDMKAAIKLFEAFVTVNLLVK